MQWWTEPCSKLQEIQIRSLACWYTCIVHIPSDIYPSTVSSRWLIRRNHFIFLFNSGPECFARQREHEPSVDSLYLQQYKVTHIQKGIVFFTVLIYTILTFPRHSYQNYTRIAIKRRHDYSFTSHPNLSYHLTFKALSAMSGRWSILADYPWHGKWARVSHNLSHQKLSNSQTC